MSGIPILVEAEGLRVLVVGGGAVAARKVRALCAAGAQVRVVSPLIDAAIRELADAGDVVLVERTYEPGDIGDAELVIAATPHRATNAAVATNARAAHRLVNVADAGAEGSFSAMAVHRAGTLVVGVSAGVPAAAGKIRDAIAGRFDERYTSALRELVLLRQQQLVSGDTARWRAISDDVAGAGFCDAVESGAIADRLRPWR